MRLVEREVRTRVQDVNVAARLERADERASEHACRAPIRKDGDEERVKKRTVLCTLSATGSGLAALLEVRFDEVIACCFVLRGAAFSVRYFAWCSDTLPRKMYLRKCF